MDINKALEATITVARNEWKYHCEVGLDLDDGLPPVPALAGPLKQAILVIIINAAQAVQDAVEHALVGVVVAQDLHHLAVVVLVLGVSPLAEVVPRRGEVGLVHVGHLSAHVALVLVHHVSLGQHLLELLAQAHGLAGLPVRVAVIREHDDPQLSARAFELASLQVVGVQHPSRRENVWPAHEKRSTHCDGAYAVPQAVDVQDVKTGSFHV